MYVHTYDTLVTKRLLITVTYTITCENYKDVNGYYYSETITIQARMILRPVSSLLSPTNWSYAEATEEQLVYPCKS